MSASGNLHGFRWIRLSTRLAIYDRDGWCCLACGRRGSWRPGRGTWEDCRPEALSLDHVVPRSAGGGNEPSNLVTLCVSCNSARAEEPFETWRPDLVHVVLDAVTTPIDRRLGMALAEELAPAWVEMSRETKRRSRMSMCEASA